MHLSAQEIEAMVRRLVREGEVENMTHPRVLDCPVCKHETLSESRQTKTDDGEKHTAQYCFGCGNLFLKETKWKQQG